MRSDPPTRISRADVLAGFSVALIPHTLQVTTLGKKLVGDPVNIESDLLAKYVERQLQLNQLYQLIKYPN